MLAYMLPLQDFSPSRDPTVTERQQRPVCLPGLGKTQWEKKTMNKIQLTHPHTTPIPLTQSLEYLLSHKRSRALLEKIRGESVTHKLEVFFFGVFTQWYFLLLFSYHVVIHTQYLILDTESFPALPSSSTKVTTLIYVYYLFLRKQCPSFPILYKYEIT